MADELKTLMVERALQQQAMKPSTYETRSAPVRPTTMAPETLALIGGLADAASTAVLLKRGGVELNPMYARLHNNPVTTGLAVAGSSLAMKGMRHLLRKKVPWLADALAANQGAMQLGLAAANVQMPRSAFDLSHQTFAMARRHRGHDGTK